MTQGAKLQSLDALLEAKAAVLTFAHEVAAALTGVDAEVMRVGQWLQHERPAFWKAEVRRREDDVGAARREIERKVIAAAPEPASTVMERKALEACKKRVESAREKQDNARRWASRWDREALLYKSSCSGLAEFAGSDVLRAHERLDRLITIVDQYMKIAPPTADETGLGMGAGAAAEVAGSMQAFAADGIGAEAAAILLREDDVPTLRSRVPVGDARAGLAIVPPPDPFIRFAPLRELDAGSLRRLEISGELPSLESKVVLSWRCLDAPAVFLTRAQRAVDMASGEPDTSDSGWSIGPAHDPDSTSGWIAVRLGDVLAVRPEFEAVLRLAPGAIAVLGGGSVRWVFNEFDHNLWVPHA